MGREVKRVDKRMNRWWNPEFRDGPWWGYLLQGVPCGMCSDMERRGCFMCSDGIAWPKIQPPEGEWWQLWETVSEGSPISPAFETPEDLADWMAAPGNDTSVTRGLSRDEWLRFIKGPGWAPSMATNDGGELVSGVEAFTPPASDA